MLTDKIDYDQSVEILVDKKSVIISRDISNNIKLLKFKMETIIEFFRSQSSPIHRLFSLDYLLGYSQL